MPAVATAGRAQAESAIATACLHRRRVGRMFRDVTSIIAATSCQYTQLRGWTNSTLRLKLYPNLERYLDEQLAKQALRKGDETKGDAMRIQWLRVLLGGFLIEVVLAITLIGGFAAAGVDLAKGVSTASALIIGGGCFAAAALIVLWLG